MDVPTLRYLDMQREGGRERKSLDFLGDQASFRPCTSLHFAEDKTEPRKMENHLPMSNIFGEIRPANASPILLAGETLRG